MRADRYCCDQWVFGLGVVIALALASTRPANAAPARSYYKGKTIRITIGLPTGGIYDLYGRLIARHIGNHIPGRPDVIPQNMPGAGSVRAANYIYNIAPKNGTEFGIVTFSALTAPLFGDKQALFKSTKFSWLGSASQEVSFCGVGPASKITSFSQWLKTGKPLSFGAAGSAAISFQQPMVLKNVLHANMHLIAGYGGTGEIVLALARGEVDAMCAMSASALKAQAPYQQMIKSGKLKLIVQMGPYVDGEFGNIPSIFDYAKTKRQREVLSLAFNRQALGMPFIAPPGIPQKRYKILAKAFAETLKDPQLLADAAKMNLNVNYLSGDRATKLLNEFAHYSPLVIKEAKQALGQ